MRKYVPVRLLGSLDAMSMQARGAHVHARVCEQIARVPTKNMHDLPWARQKAKSTYESTCSHVRLPA